MLLRLLYSTLWYLLWPVLLLRLLWRSRNMPAYRHRLKERLGFFPAPKSVDRIWLHTVSVGEFLAARPFILALIKAYPQFALTITTVTPTGSEQVKHFIEKESLNIHHVYMPYDMPGSVKRFLDKIKPKVAILFETELWLNAMRACQSRTIPVLLMNARLSERSQKKYARFPAFTSQLLENLTAIAAQSKADARRFAALGFSEENIVVTGNVKFDLLIKESDKQAGQALREQLGVNRPVWIVASTHQGEENQILSILPKLKEALPDLCTVLVPRHPDRFDQVATLCRNAGFDTVRRSETKDQPITVKDIYLADTMGEMMTLFASSDVAFVAGSLIPIGGHNVLEPVSLGVPTIVGQHMFNFATIREMLLEEHALLEVAKVEQLVEMVSTLFSNQSKQDSMRVAGLNVMQAQKGVLTRMLGLISHYVEKKKLSFPSVGWYLCCLFTL